MTAHSIILSPFSLLLAACLVTLLPASSWGQPPVFEFNGAAEPSTDAAAYGLGVRDTPWLSAEQELSKMHLPPGFEIRLFASEPQITKPLNMAFDRQGRMWMTQSVEYPYPAKEGQPARDAVMILEDTDGDGSADKVTQFADGLNIPIGILPYGDGCLCFSIPNIWYLRDTDGDGKCDRREVVLGPFDTTRDAHGMINSLRDGGDGWIYACHGFNNRSTVAGTDGHQVTMHSGNTFRFRPDGSRVEQITFGQVNPFGTTEDQWGYRYSADCHSKPITQLVRGACYPSFGTPHDGLGFLPPMVEHLHGSTAICGVLYFPPYSPIVPLRSQMISGNVMTSRINRNRVSYVGATAKGKELPDFLTCDDPWFRPVDIQMGPDGNIYVADFYNKIIGHYEVPLDHPERDRKSGRIWQIRYKGRKSVKAIPTTVDEALAIVKQTDQPEHVRLAALRFLGGHSVVDRETILGLLKDKSATVRCAAMHLASESLTSSGTTPTADQLRVVARSSLTDPIAHVARAAAELLGLHGSALDIDLLQSRLDSVSVEDVVQRQTIRIALRQLLQDSPKDAEIWSETPSVNLASVMLGAERSEVSSALLRFLSKHPDDSSRDALLAKAATHATAESLAECVRIARQITQGQPAKQLGLLDVLCRSQNARPGNVAGPLRSWALELVDAQLSSIDNSTPLISWSTDDGVQWSQETRQLRRVGPARLTSSLGRGEKYTGSLVSDDFPAPDKIAFWIAGHNGFPSQPGHGKNRILLRRSDSGEVIREVTAPRNDVAEQVRWDTTSIAGEMVRMECIDGDSGAAFAWIAFGKFQPAWIGDSPSENALRTSLQWINRLGLDERADQLKTLLGHDLSPRLRLEIARTIASLGQQNAAAVVLQFLQSSSSPAKEIEAAIDATMNRNDVALAETTKLLCKRMTGQQQREFVSAWAQNGAPIETLIQMAQSGWVSPVVFLDATIDQLVSPRLSDDQKSTLATLTKNLDVNAELDATLVRLQGELANQIGDRIRGHALFTKHCAACHQLRGEGTVVGPQLDGAVTRSVARLLEDVVTPDRNVDRAFRTTSILLDDGRVIVGLVTIETEKTITLVESSGKAVVIDMEAVELRREAGRSLMPSNMAEVLSADELSDLISFVRGT